MSGIAIGAPVKDWEQEARDLSALVLRLRAEVALYRMFESRVRAELAEAGAITKAEIRTVLAELDAGKRVLNP